MKTAATERRRHSFSEVPGSLRWVFLIIVILIGWQQLMCSSGNDCPAGMISGKCGLEGKCIECFLDSDCMTGQICDMSGSCVDHTPCGPENNCTHLETCAEDGRCRKSCNAPSHCDFPGSYCENNRYCATERCTEDHSCPDGWEEIEDSLECKLVDCIAVGKMQGGCGLVGHCVDCLTDSDCPSVLDCDHKGRCAIDVHWECEYNEDCQVSLVSESVYCEQRRCFLRCDSDIECRTSICSVGNTCWEAWCSQDGICPDDWRPIDNSLICKYDPCPDEGKITGRGGLAGQCIECLIDDHCLEGICSLAGTCGDLECSTDKDCIDGKKCFTSRCLDICNSNSDCEDNENCQLSSGVCNVVRCSESGMCPMPFEWEPVAGTLACRKRN